LSGEIKNASSLKTWPIFQHQTIAPPTSLQARLQQITRIANQVNIALPSQINIIIHGDATNTSSFDAFMMLRTPEVQTPWCHVIKGDVFLRLSPPPAFHGPSKLAWNLAADAVETDYARVRNFRSELVALGDDKLSDLIRARMESSASKITTSWAEVDNARLSAHWAHSLTNPMPNEGSVALLLTNITTRWANAFQARLTASLQTPASSMPIQPEWGFWNALAPYVLGLQADLQNVTAGDFQSPRVDVSGSWKAPFLQITNLYQNVLIANAQDVKGDEALDMVKKKMTMTFGGREVVVGYNASPGRLDGLCLPSWGITEMKEPSLYDFGSGVTSMPVPDPNGNGWLTSSIFYYNAALNLFNSNMKSGAYVTSAAEPTI
jgi:hypothetical protein